MAEPDIFDEITGPSTQKAQGDIFDEISGPAAAAPSAPPKTPAEQQFETAVGEQVRQSIPKPRYLRPIQPGETMAPGETRAEWERRPESPARAAQFNQPYNVKKGIVGGITDILAGGTAMPTSEFNAPPPGEQAIKATEELGTPGQRGKGALRLAATGLAAATPLVGPAALETGAAVEAAPSLAKALTPPMVRAMAGGAAGSQIAKYGAKALGASPETQALAEQVGWALPLVYGATSQFLSKGYAPFGADPVDIAAGTLRSLAYKYGLDVPETPTTSQMAAIHAELATRINAGGDVTDGAALAGATKTIGGQFGALSQRIQKAGWPTLEDIIAKTQGGKPEQPGGPGTPPSISPRAPKAAGGPQAKGGLQPAGPAPPPATVEVTPEAAGPSLLDRIAEQTPQNPLEASLRTTEAAQAPDPIVEALAKQQQSRTAAERVVNGLPPTEPQPPAPPPPRVTQDLISNTAKQIAKLPEDARAEAMQQAHAKLAGILLAQGQQGPVVLPDGTLALIKKPEDAEKQALEIINQAVEDHDKATAQPSGEGKRGKVAAAPSPAAAIPNPKAVKPRDIFDEAAKQPIAAPQKPTQPVSTAEGTSEVTNAEAPKTAAKPPEEAHAGAGHPPAAEEKVESQPERPGVAGKTGVEPSEGTVPKEPAAPLKKGDRVALAKDIEVGGKKIAAGTPVLIQYSHPNGLLVRGVTDDGTKISRGIGAFARPGSESVRVPLESHGTEGTTLSGAGPRKTEQLHGGVPERRSPSNNQPERAAESKAGRPADTVSGGGNLAGTTPGNVPERRQDLAKRKRISEMSHEELKKELLTSPITNLPNRRAFDEAEHTKSPAVAMSDADGLKALNDKFGYEAGNELLRAKAEALKEAGLDAYHEKGDEFLYRGASEEELQSKLEKAREILRNRVIEVTTPDGKVERFVGGDFSYGSGSDLAGAEQRLKAHKSEREARGERARGELRNIRRVTPEGLAPGNEGKSPAQEVKPTGLTSGPTIEQEQPSGENPTQRGREVRTAESHGGGELARTQPETGEAPREAGQPRTAVGRSHGERHPNTEPVSGTGTGAGSGEGTGLRESSPADRIAATVKTPKPAARNKDWFTHPEDFSVDATESKRLEWNVKALKILKAVENGEKLTDEDRDALAHYVGWGALQWAFDPYRSPWDQQKKWIEANRELKELMSEEEMEAAKRSTQNAHYTSPLLARWHWSALERMGFKGGVIMEPSGGLGIYAGTMPKAIRNVSQLIYNELDPVTFRIAKLLYPSATMFNKDFVELMLPNDSVDVAVSNVPFGVKVYDKNYPNLKASIHDYFFVKSLDKVRPGGVVAFITSTFTMDKQRSDIRELLADKADLVFALRFPQDTFAKSAGTAVATDLIFLRKRIPGDQPAGERFLGLRDVQAKYNTRETGREGSGTQQINEYFADYPENVLGELEIGRGRTTSNPETLVVKPADNFEELLKKALDRVPKDGYISKRSASPLLRADTEEAFASDDLEEGNYTLDKKGNPVQRQNGKLVPTDVYLDKDGKPSPVLKDRLTRLIGIRDATRDLMRLMRSLPDEPVANKQIEKAQLKLAIQVKEYQKKHGYFAERKTKDVFQDDPHYPLILSLEDYDKPTKVGTPAPILSKRTIYPEAKLTALSADPKEALYQVLGERGKPDIEFMAGLSGKSEEEIAKPLVEQGLIFKEPVTGQWETRAKYLSGYVREKLTDAKAAVAQGNKEYQKNVEELEKVQPKRVTINSGEVDERGEPKDIQIKLGATWIPTQVVAGFAKEVLKSPWADVKYADGQWKVSDLAHTAEVSSEYAGGGMTAGPLIEMALNQKQPVVKDRIPGGPGEPDREVVNPDKTIAAKRAQQKIKEAFAKWARTHAKWAPQLEDIYNEKMNNLVTPQHDGSHMTFPGMNKSILRDGRLMPHQMDAVWKIVEDGRALLAHVVGAGKTFEMIAAAMELKRLGRIRKPLFAVPNHLVGQWAADFLKLYPGAKILVPDKKDFESVRRNKIMSRIATGDWDAVILPHSQFNLMDISPERQLVTLEKELDELEEAYRHAQAAEGKRGYTVKRLEKAKDRLRAKMAELKDLKADKTIRFDDTGVDMLFIDEAHAYKNLAFYTKMERVAGLAQGDSKRATRLKMKTDYLLEKYGNRGVVFATGTPIQNTMAEMYNMIKYLAPDVLQKAGIKYFDDWAANFGEVITAMELGVDGRTYKPRSKFSRFTNVPELQMMFRSFADVKTKEDLNLPTPEIEGGKPQALTAIPTPELEQYVQGLIRRAKILRGEGVPQVDADGKPVMVEEYKDGKPTGKMVQAMEHFKRPDPREDNMLKLTGDGRKAATDLRLIDPNYPDDPQSKINKIVDKVFEEWKEGRRDTRVIDPATVMPLENLTGAIFLDNYQFLQEVGAEYSEEGKVTKRGKEEVLLNLYRDMADKLVAKGVPRKEIAIIHDYPKQEQKTALFQSMNKGEVRILFGSTEKMGAGMNAQERMKYLIDADSPWRPGDLEQRHGRIIRQGNKNKSVRLYHAVTKGTFDSYMIQTLKGKAEFINQVMSGKFTGRTMTDAAGDMVLSLEEMLAASSNNPDVKRKMELEAEVATLQALEREHEAKMYRNKRDAEYERDRAAQYETIATSWTKIKADWDKATEGDKFTLKILGKTFDKYGDANEWIKDQNAPAVPFHFELNGVPIRFVIGQFPDGVKMGYEVQPFRSPRFIDSFSSLITSAHSYLLPKHIEGRIQEAEASHEAAIEKADKLEKLATKSGFEDADRLKKAQQELETVKKRLGLSDEAGAAEQDVAAEVDDSPEGPEPAENEEEAEDRELDTRRRFGNERGFATPSALSGGPLGEKVVKAVGEFIFQDVEPALKKAGVGMKEVPAMFVRALYPRIEESNPIGRALDVAAPSDAVDALMKVQGDRAKALAEFDLVLKSVEKMFDRLPEESRIEFIDRIQTGQKQPTSDLEDLADVFRKIMDAQRAEEIEAINLGRRGKQIELAKKQNYFHNWWDVRPGKEPEEEEGERISRLFIPKRPFEGTKGYNKRQSYTLKSGIEAGGEPVTTNPVRILRHRIEDGMKFVTARRAWNETNELGLRSFVRKGARPPAGFDKIDDKIAKVYFPAFLEFPGMEEPKVVPHELGEWYVESNTARLLNNMLSVDKIRKNALGRGLMWLKNASTAIELGLSPFHAIFESIEAISSMLSLGLQRAYNQGLRQQKPAELVQGIKDMIASPAAPLTLAREGAAVPAYIEARARLGKIGLTEYGHVISGEQPHGVMEALKQFQELRKEKAVQRLIRQYPDLDQLIDDMFQGGLVIGQHRDYQVRSFGKTAMEAYSAGNPIGAIWRAIPTLHQAVMYPLFNWYIPNLKYSLFLKMMSEAASEHAAELEDGSLTRATLARRVADSVENRFGELNFDNLFLNRTTKTALQFLFRSVTYKLGTIREFSGAAGGQTRELSQWAKDAYDLLSHGGGGRGGKGGEEGGGGGGEEGGRTFTEKALPRLDPRASWVASLMILTAMLGTIAAKLLSGKYPWQWLEEDKNLAGNGAEKLMLEMTHPRTGEVDSRGKPVRVGLPTYWKDVEHATADPGRYVLSSLSGIVSRGIDTAENRDYSRNYVFNPNAPLGTKLKQIGEYNFPMPFVASNFLRGRSEHESKTKWLSAFGFPKSPSDLDFTPAEKLARDIIKAHESPATPEEMEAWREKFEAFRGGKLPYSQAKAFMKRQRETMLQRQLKNSAVSYADARRIYDAANADEKKILDPIMREKRMRLLREGRASEAKAAQAVQ